MTLKFLVLNFLYFVIRPIVVRFIDPIIKVRIGRRKIFFPLSHNFPLFTKLFPNYAQNVGRLGRIVLEKYPRLKLIDVGANVGDTVAVLRKYANFPILCVEGNPIYFKLLKRNVAGFKKVDSIQAYLGIDNKTIKAKIVGIGGTARISSGLQTSDIKTRRLEKILEIKKNFADSKFLKIDTDGYDTLIIKGALSWLKRIKPIIFFEYSPDLLSNNNEEGTDTFRLLRSINYKQAIFYNNFGEYLLSTQLDNEELIEDITTYLSGKGEKEHCDVCVFHSEDSDVFKRAKKKERKYFKKL